MAEFSFKIKHNHKRHQQEHPYTGVEPLYK